MARDQDLSPMLSFYEWGQEVLAMPHGHDQRSVVGNAFVDVGRLGSERAGVPYEAQIFGRQCSGRQLKRMGSKDSPAPRHYREEDITEKKKTSRRERERGY